MQKTLGKYDVRSLGKPDEVRTFDKGKVEIFNLANGSVVGRVTFEPGWKWSTCIGPIAKTKSCQAEHVCYQLSGQVHVVLDGGEEFEMRAGELCYLPPGHDGWVVGDEPAVILDFQGMKDYAKESSAERRPREGARKH